MTSSTSSSSAPQRLLAVIAPLAIVGAVLGWWGRPDPADDVAPVAVTACKEQLARDGADVVVFGNSKARSDLDLTPIGKALDVTKISRLNVNGTRAPVWYAMMERCLADVSPKLIIVYGTLGSMVRVTLESELERNSMAELRGQNDPVLVRKVFGGDVASPFWDRVRARRTALHQGFQQGTRDLVAGFFFAPPGEDGLLAAGAAYAGPALERVLGEDAGGDVARRARAVPIAERSEEAAEARELGFEDTLVPDFVALANARGARILFVNAPMSPSWQAHYEVIPAALTRATIEGLNELGAGYIDLSRIGLPDAAFADGIHMNNTGRARTTAALAERLADVGATGTGAFARAMVPSEPPTGRRTGTPPSLPPLTLTRGPWDCGWQAPVPGLAPISDATLGAAGIGALSPLLVLEDGKPLTPHATRDTFDLTCAGASNHQGGVVKFSPTGGPADVARTRTYTLGVAEDMPMRDAIGNEGWWVYPGTTLTLDFPGPWDGPAEGFRVAVEGYAAGGAGAVTLEAGRVTATLARGAERASAVLAPDAPTAPWSLTVTSPSDGPWFLVNRVVVGTPTEPWYAVGTPEKRRSVELVGAPARYGAPPDPLPEAALVGAPKQFARGLWYIDAPDLGVPYWEIIRDTVSIAGCSPVRLSRDGEPMPGPDTPPADLMDKGAEGYNHADRRLYLGAGAGRTPEGHRYAVSLDEARACRNARWIYPGDTLTLTPNPQALDRLTAPAELLELGLAAVTRDPTSERARVRFSRGAEVLVDAEVALGDLARTPARWPLAAQVERGAEGLVLEISTSDAAPYLVLTSVTLAQAARPPFPPLAPDAAATAAPSVGAGAAVAGE